MNENNANLVAEVNYTWTYQYFKQYNKTINSADKRINKIVNWFLIITLASSSYLLLSDGGVNEYVGTILALLTLLSISAQFSNPAKSLYNSNKMSHGMNTTVLFYDEYFVCNDQYSTMRVPYYMLKGIKQSKYGYALLIQLNQGLFIPVNHCSDELTELIETKLYILKI